MMMKKIIIIIGVFFLIYLFILPTIPIAKPQYYSQKKIERMIGLAKNNDIDSIRKLLVYYGTNNNTYNARLIECKMLQTEVVSYFNLEVSILKNQKKCEICPTQPLELLENNYYWNYLHYIWIAKEFP